MPLIKQNVALPLAQNLDTKTDEKQLAIGNVTVLENTMFTKPGKLLKRNGNDSIVLEDSTGSNITGSKALATFKKELTLFNSENMYSRIPSLNRWSNKGRVFTILPDSTPVVRTNVEQSNLDSVHLEGLNIFAWEDSNGVSLSIVDNESKNFIINKEVLSATGTDPKVVARDSQIYIIYTDGTALKFRKFSIFDFNNIDAEVTAVAAISATYTHFDATLVADRVMISYSESVGDDLTFIAIKSDDTMSSAVTVAGEQASVCVNLITDTASRVVCTYYDGTDVKIVIFNYTLGTKILAETSLETITNITNVAAIESTYENYTIVYEVSATETYNHFLKKQTITLAGVTGTASILKRSVGLASKLFMRDSVIYFTTLHDNALQSTYFLLDIDGNIVSKISPNVGGDLITSGSLPRISAIDSDNYLLTSQVKGRLVEDNGTFFSLLGVNSTILDFEPDLQLKTATRASNLHIAGGFLKMYDGTNVVEHGFHLYPEGLENGGTAVTGGVLSDGTYQYKAIYAWTDAQGTIHRSATSVGFEVVLSGGGSAQTQTITVPTLRLTNKENVIIELYRTEASGTIFYKVSSTTSPTANDPTVDSIDILDSSISDADLISQEVIYSTGGELENFAAPACSIIVSAKERVFVTTPESSKISYSKLQFEGFPVEFNDTLEIVVPDEGGRNVTMQAMDDKVILFKESSIYHQSGDGPNNIGEQDSFAELELISNDDIGCSEPNSVVSTPEGIMFKSKKGIYLLDKSLSTTYIGAAVEKFNDLTITSAVVVPKKNQVRFTTSDGDCLVYNYVQRKWGTFTNHKALSAVNLDSDYYYLRPDNLLYRENEEFNDNGSAIKMKIETGWITFTGVQEFQRVYKLLILGQYKSAHKLRIRVAYNFKDAWVQEKIIDTSDFIDPAVYGGSDTYGSDNVFGGAGTPYQIRLALKQQKCQSIKISIEDLQATVGEGLELSNILFRVGSKPTEFKINQAQQYGME